jgi:hypothetical protein
MKNRFRSFIFQKELFRRFAESSSKIFCLAKMLAPIWILTFDFGVGISKKLIKIIYQSTKLKIFRTQTHKPRIIRIEKPRKNRIKLKFTPRSFQI